MSQSKPTRRQFTKTAALVAAAPLAAVIPMPVESIVGEGGGQRRENESNANKTAERDNSGLAHVLLLPGGADKLRPIGDHASTSGNVTQRNRSVLLHIAPHTTGRYSRLHAYARTGIINATPKTEIALIRQRLKEAYVHYEQELAK